MTLYLAPELAKRAGVTLRQVQYWTELGILRTVQIKGQVASGSGNYRIYDETEAEIARAMSALISRADLAKAIRAAIEGRPAHVGGLTIQRQAVSA